MAFASFSEEGGTASQSKVTVGTTSTAIVSANDGRIAVLIRNLSSETVYVNIGNTATTNDFPLLQYDALELNQTDLSKQAINGIVASGTADVRVIEITS